MHGAAGGRLLADRYRLDGVLGTGGMARVHRAWDVRMRRPVAVKLFTATDEVGARRFAREARTLAALTHPALVPVYDLGRAGATSFVVMRLLDGGTLRDLVADGPLPPDRVRAAGARLADALAHVHGHGVVHRDVKPANVLLDHDGAAHLADFGLARSADGTRFTRGDEVVGTAPYLAPEQLRGEDVGPPADVYALGLVLLECLTGRREYTGEAAAEARLQRPPHVPRDLPADLVRLLTLMTSLSARRRPGAAECARALGDR
ncbi:serine/threonine-protein kinase [Saccharothrix syringae]|uniref:non-specific serine/threonine protein kinase n=1 Tax=Saccharothrix syringae TaxID=103733 RepID=A0A5Q0H1P5_SACSY|nr:serine/threonine-protein kinase [Saccharothrix syringae]QFZ20177.1 serine/threonine protein kinase [Saccharothrix syringae]